LSLRYAPIRPQDQSRGPVSFGELLDTVDQIARKENQIAEQKQPESVRAHYRRLNVDVVKDDGENYQDNRDKQRQLCWWRESKRHPSAKVDPRNFITPGV